MKETDKDLKMDGWMDREVIRRDTLVNSWMNCLLLRLLSLRFNYYNKFELYSSYDSDRLKGTNA